MGELLIGNPTIQKNFSGVNFGAIVCNFLKLELALKCLNFLLMGRFRCFLSYHQFFFQLTGLPFFHFHIKD